jgi:hypothetical protein
MGRTAEGRDLPLAWDTTPGARPTTTVVAGHSIGCHRGVLGIPMLCLTSRGNAPTGVVRGPGNTVTAGGARCRSTGRRGLPEAWGDRGRRWPYTRGWRGSIDPRERAAGSRWLECERLRPVVAGRRWHSLQRSSWLPTMNSTLGTVRLSPHLAMVTNRRQHELSTEAV